MFGKKGACQALFSPSPGLFSKWSFLINVFSSNKELKNTLLDLVSVEGLFDEVTSSEVAVSNVTA